MISKCLQHIADHGSAEQLTRRRLSVEDIAALPELPPISELIRSLPTSMGGFGLRKSHQVTRAAYVSSWLNSLSWINSNLSPNLWHTVVEKTYSAQMKEVLADPAISSYIGNVEDVEALKTAMVGDQPNQKSLTITMVDQPNKLILQNILQAIPTKAAFFRSQSNEDGMLWLSNLQTKSCDHIISEQSFFTNFRCGLLLDNIDIEVVNGVRCACNQQLHGEEINYHALACHARGVDGYTGPSGIAIRRHNAIRDALAVFLIKSCPQGSVVKEYNLPLNENSEHLRMDVQLSLGNQVLLFDVVVKSPTTQAAILAHSNNEELVAAKRGEQDKISAFRRVYSPNGQFSHLNRKFIPFAVEATGALGPMASRVIHYLQQFPILLPKEDIKIKRARLYFRRRLASILANERAALVSWFQHNFSRDYFVSGTQTDNVTPP